MVGWIKMEKNRWMDRWIEKIYEKICGWLEGWIEKNIYGLLKG